MSTAFIAQVINLTNQERAKAGLSALVPDSRLINAAEAHSEDMALKDYFSHTGLDGSTFNSRAAAFGFNGAAAENIGAGYTAPEAVVSGWMSSPNHRQNILNPNLQSIGVGYFFLANDTGNINYKHYWVQVLGRTSGNNTIPSGSTTGSSSNSDNTDSGNTDSGNTDSDKTNSDNTDSGNTDSGNSGVVGTEGHDELLGTSGHDTLSGRGGHDWLHGRQGNDRLLGEAGNDTLRGGKGDDFLSGGDGNDWLYGDRENDTVIGGNGDDTLYGGKDNDSLVGDAGNDVLGGDLGRDTLIGGPGRDTYILGGDMFDVVFYNDREDFIQLPTDVTFADLIIRQGFDEFVPDKQVETLITNRNTGQLIAVLPGVEASLIGPEDFI